MDETHREVLGRIMFKLNHYSKHEFVTVKIFFFFHFFWRVMKNNYASVVIYFSYQSFRILIVSLSQYDDSDI